MLQKNEKARQVYATIKEICGIDDHHVIDEAIQACASKDGTYRLEDVVSMLIQDESLRKKSVSLFVYLYIYIYMGHSQNVVLLQK